MFVCMCVYNIKFLPFCYWSIGVLFVSSLSVLLLTFALIFAVSFPPPLKKKLISTVFNRVWLTVVLVFTASVDSCFNPKYWSGEDLYCCVFSLYCLIPSGLFWSASFLLPIRKIHPRVCLFWDNNLWNTDASEVFAGRIPSPGRTWDQQMVCQGFFVSAGYHLCVYLSLHYMWSA